MIKPGEYEVTLKVTIIINQEISRNDLIKTLVATHKANNSYAICHPTDKKWLTAALHINEVYGLPEPEICTACGQEIE